jgi:hypothetical protein
VHAACEGGLVIYLRGGDFDRVDWTFEIRFMLGLVYVAIFLFICYPRKSLFQTKRSLGQKVNFLVQDKKENCLLGLRDNVLNCTRNHCNPAMTPLPTAYNLSESLIFFLLASVESHPLWKWSNFPTHNDACTCTHRGRCRQLSLG